MIKAILTDIEGTTTSLSFVKDILFPYARENIKNYIEQHVNDPQVSQLLSDVAVEAKKKLNAEGAVNQLIQWIDEDKKVTPLKALQGLLWEEGYLNGDYRGHVYPDAYDKISDWHEQGIKLYVYSSGSVYAQKLLYGYSDYGDMTRYFNGYFDTKIGGKTEQLSYEKIAAQMSQSPNEILFLSDIEAELDAAKAAGMKTIWLVRDGVVSDKNDSSTKYPQVTTFESILLN